MKKYLVHIVWLVIAIVVFAGGMYYGKASATSSSATRFGGFSGSTARGSFAARGGNGGGFVAGQVTAKDAQSLTVALPNGNSEIVFYSSSTSVIKPAPASISDIVPGTDIVVGGTQNSDGSVTAQTIQVRESGLSGAPNGAPAPP